VANRDSDIFIIVECIKDKIYNLKDIWRGVLEEVRSGEEFSDEALMRDFQKRTILWEQKRKEME